MPQAQPVDGWFVSFTGTEHDDICAVLEDAGCELTPKGLKEYLLSKIGAEETPMPRQSMTVEFIKEWLKDHPEDVQKVVGSFTGALGNLLTRLGSKDRQAKP